jgi:HEAT repeat protein
VAAILAQEPYEALLPRLQDRHGLVRRGAALELGRRGRWGAVPPLIGLLDDREEPVRAAAASSLRRLTNEYFGYARDSRGGQRAAVSARWREWWNLEGRARAAEQDGTSRSS